MKKRKTGILFILIIVSLISLGIASAGTCVNDRDRIMKIYSATNAHGALWNDASYTYEICYKDIFGSEYNGVEADVHACIGTNKIIGLSSTTNAHAEIPSNTGYTTNVCYGDLTCRKVVDPTNCDPDEKAIVRLYQDTNSHISYNLDTNYPIKICCKIGVKRNAYWADMMDTPINKADKNADVKLTVKDERLSQKEANFTIYQEGSAFRRIMSKITFGLISKDILTGNIIGYGSTTWATETGNKYYFIATSASDSSVSIDSRIDNTYGFLNVSSTENNKPIGVEIIYPSYSLPKESRRFKVEKKIPFEFRINSVDDNVQIRVDFGDGNITEETNCLTTNKERCRLINHSYSKWGTKNVEITAKEMRRGQEAENYTMVFIYNKSINVFAVITQPPLGKVFGQGIKLINFNANESYVANCTTDACASCTYNVEDLHCYDFPKTGARGIGIAPGQYNLWFDWSFSEGARRYGNWTDNRADVVDFKKVFYAPIKHHADLKTGYEQF